MGNVWTFVLMVFFFGAVGTIVLGAAWCLLLLALGCVADLVRWAEQLGRRR